MKKKTLENEENEMMKNCIAVRMEWVNSSRYNVPIYICW